MILIRRYSGDFLSEAERLLNQTDVVIKGIFAAPHENREDSIYIMYEKQ